jgi:hypothetical protein
MRLELVHIHTRGRSGHRLHRGVTVIVISGNIVRSDQVKGYFEGAIRINIDVRANLT